MEKKKTALGKYLAEIGKKGGQERAKRLTAKQRSESAKKAGIASGKARAAKPVKK